MSNENNQLTENSQEDKQKEFIFKEKKLKKFSVTYGLLIITIFIFILFAVLHPRFASQRNIFNLLAQGSIIGFFSLGLTNILISGNFDISFGANATLCSIVALICISEYKIPLVIVYLIVLGLAMAISTMNGILVVYGRIPAFICTIGTMGILTGVSKWITGGSFRMFPLLPPAFKAIGKGKIAGVFPVILLIYLIAAFCEIIFLERTYKGRHFYGVGTNPQAAIRAGLNINRIKFQAFIIMGLIAGIAGIAMGSLFEAGNAEAADSFVFPTVIVTLLGAVFLKEGVPNVPGTVVAAILMAEIANGFTLLGFPLWIKEVTEGFILIVAVSIVSILKPGGIPPVKVKRS